MPLSFLRMILRNPAAHPQGSDTPPPGSLLPGCSLQAPLPAMPSPLHSHCLKIQCQRKKFPDHLPIIFIRHDTHDKMEFFIRIHCLQTFFSASTPLLLCAPSIRKNGSLLTSSMRPIHCVRSIPSRIACCKAFRSGTFFFLQNIFQKIILLQALPPRHFHTGAHRAFSL